MKARYIPAFIIQFAILFSSFAVLTTSAVSPPNQPDCSQNPQAAECHTNAAPTVAPDSGASGVIPNPFTAGGTNPTIPDLLRAIFDKILLPIGSVLAVMGFIFAGFRFVTAGGDVKKIGSAKTALLYTAIGTAVLLGADLISQVLGNTLQQLQ